MEDIDTKAFLKEREDKLGAPIVWKTYATFFAELCGEKREYGVFIYSDGKTLCIEDFERVPSIMGIVLPSKRNKEKYVKLEISIHISEIEDVNLVTRSSVDSSLKALQDKSKIASPLDKLLKKLVTKVKLKNGKTYFFEFMNHKDFKNWINREKEKFHGSI